MRIIVALDITLTVRVISRKVLGPKTIGSCISAVSSARQGGARVALGSVAAWLAFNDADTTIPPDWLAAQMALKCDAA